MKCVSKYSTEDKSTIVLGNSFMMSGKKPLPEPMLTNIHMPQGHIQLMPQKSTNTFFANMIHKYLMPYIKTLPTILLSMTFMTQIHVKFLWWT